MRAHRLRRLQLLTQGVALLGMGVAETACQSPPDSIHINAPYVPPDAGQPPVEPPHLNAPYVAPDAGAAPAPNTSAEAKPPLQLATSATPSAAPSSKPPFVVPHMNATASPPKTVNAPPQGVPPTLKD